MFPAILRPKQGLGRFGGGFSEVGIKEAQFVLGLCRDLIFYTFISRPCADIIVATVHNTQDFNLLFFLNRLLQMKLLPEITMNGHKKICLKVKHVTWL